MELEMEIEDLTCEAKVVLDTYYKGRKVIEFLEYIAHDDNSPESNLYTLWVHSKDREYGSVLDYWCWEKQYRENEPKGYIYVESYTKKELFLKSRNNEYFKGIYAYFFYE